MAFFFFEIIKLGRRSHTRIPFLILNAHNISIFQLFYGLLGFPYGITHFVVDEEWLIQGIVHSARVDGADCCAVVFGPVRTSLLGFLSQGSIT